MFWSLFTKIDFWRKKITTVIFSSLRTSKYFLKNLPIVWIWQFRRHFRSGRNYGFWFFISLVSSFVGTCLEVLFGSFNFDAVDAGMLVKGCTRKDFNSSSSSRLKKFKFLMILKFSVLKLQIETSLNFNLFITQLFQGKWKCHENFKN